jgi:hypothetical protein
MKQKNDEPEHSLPVAYLGPPNRPGVRTLVDIQRDAGASKQT